jgi:hypothetical protein
LNKNKKGYRKKIINKKEGRLYDTRKEDGEETNHEQPFHTPHK